MMSCNNIVTDVSLYLLYRGGDTAAHQLIVQAFSRVCRLDMN